MEILNRKKLFICGYTGSLLLCGLPLAAASGGCSSLWCVGFSLQWLLLLQGMGSMARGLSSCSLWAYLPCGMCSLSSLTRDQTHVPGRFLTIGPLREVLRYNLNTIKLTHKKCTVRWFLVYSQICEHYHCFRIFSSPLKETTCQLTVTLIPLLPTLHACIPTQLLSRV